MDDDADDYSPAPVIKPSTGYVPVTKENWQEHHNRLRGISGNDPSSDDEVERVIDEEEDDFDDVRFTGWRQACKDILYLLYYDEDSGPFVTPLTPEALGDDVYAAYIETIERPMDF